jgi:hypothetical protein
MVMPVLVVVLAGDLVVQEELEEQVVLVMEVIMKLPMVETEIQVLQEQMVRMVQRRQEVFKQAVFIFLLRVQTELRVEVAAVVAAQDLAE